MVRHYCEEDKVAGRFGVEPNSGKHHSGSVVVGQHKMACSKDNRRDGIVGRISGVAKESSKLPVTKKTVKYSYIDESSSSDLSSSEEESGSDSLSSSSGAEDEPSPPKRMKTSSTEAEATENGDEQAVEEEYVVENVLDMKRDKFGKRFFLIKWLGYPSAQNTWEPLENLEKCQDLVDEFLEKQQQELEKQQRSKSNKKTIQKRKPESQPLPKKDTNIKTVTVNKPVINGRIKKNRMPYSNLANISNSMISSVQKVVHVPACQTINNNNEEKVEETMEVEVQKEPELTQSQEVATPETYISIPHAGDIFYFRIINDGCGNLEWIFVDMSQPLPSAEICYRVIVTEDLTGKEPKLIYGATTDVTGALFCLVQFEGHSYVEIIRPEYFFLKFPTFRRYFELKWPNLFLESKSH